MPHPSLLPAEELSFESWLLLSTSTLWAPPTFSSGPYLPVSSVWGEQPLPLGEDSFLLCNLSSFGLVGWLVGFSVCGMAPEKVCLRAETSSDWGTSYPGLLPAVSGGGGFY